jgi:hypothetical protein
VGEKQDSDGFPPHAGNQLALDGFLGHQAHGPPGAAFGGITTHHRDNPLFVAVVEHGGCAGALLFEKRGLQTALLIPAADVADRLCRQRDDLGDLRRAGAFGQLTQRQGAQNHPHLLHASA